jgi:hypothetical protein
MPATPLHFFAIAPLYFYFPTKFDIMALLFSSTFVDLELVYYFIVNNSAGHGLWHSYFFVLTVYPIILSVTIFLVKRKFGKSTLRIYNFFGLYPKKINNSFKTIYLSSLIGGVSHIFFDMWTHDYSPYILFPIVGKNPFWIGNWSIIINTLVAILSIYTLFLWIKGILNHQQCERACS